MNRRISLLSLAALGLTGALALPSVAFADESPGDSRHCQGPSPERMLAHHDADGDGALDVEEIAAMMLLRAEHHAERRDGRGPCGAERAARGEGRAERGERGEGRRGRTERGEGPPHHPRMEAARARFAEIDTNGDGRIDEEEAFAAATAFLAEHDTNGDGRLTADELPTPPHARRGRGARGTGGGSRGGR
jgi:hypothetical protein